MRALVLEGLIARVQRFGDENVKFRKSNIAPYLTCKSSEFDKIWYPGRKY